MSIRRGWTEQEDRILKMLKDERKVKKWSSIAKLMDFEFNLCGRNGKQCRERYNNHLDTGIVEKKLTHEQELLLQRLNDQIGNKWSVITKAFNGRTANYLKNQLYSKLRKSIRKLNKFIKQRRMKEVKPFKLNIVYKIVQSNDFKIFQKERHTEDDLTFYSQLKEKLFRYAEQHLVLDGVDEIEKNDIIQESRSLIREMHLFSIKYYALNKKIKKPRKRYFCQDDIILNSLSNNPIGSSYLEHIPKIFPNMENEEDEDDSKMDDSESYESSSTSMRKQAKDEKEARGKDEINIMEVKKCDQLQNHYQKQYNLLETQQKPHEPQPHPPLPNGTPSLLPLLSNSQLIEQGELSLNHKVSLMLQQSEQCQFMDIQYLDHFKSFSFIDESLFQ